LEPQLAVKRNTILRLQLDIQGFLMFDI
jgi:hypothetical protein